MSYVLELEKQLDAKEGIIQDYVESIGILGNINNALLRDLDEREEAYENLSDLLVSKNTQIVNLDWQITKLKNEVAVRDNHIESYRGYKDAAKNAIEEYEKLQETYEDTLQAVIKERDEALAGQISRFYENGVPVYAQGAPTHEFQSVVTAAGVTNLFQSLIKTEEELAGIKDVYRTLINKLS